MGCVMGWDECIHAKYVILSLTHNSKFAYVNAFLLIPIKVDCITVKIWSFRKTLLNINTQANNHLNPYLYINLYSLRKVNTNNSEQQYKI